MQSNPNIQKPEAAHPQDTQNDEKTETFAGRVRAVMLALSPGEITTEQLAEKLSLDSVERRKLNPSIADFLARGEIERVGEATYKYKNNSFPRTKKQVMWRLLRARRRVTVEDMQELADVSAYYAREWLRNLVKIGVARKIAKPGTKAVWQLVNDTVTDPETAENAKKLRILRANKRAEEKLAQAKYALDKASLEVESAIKDLADARRAWSE